MKAATNKSGLTALWTAVILALSGNLTAAELFVATNGSDSTGTGASGAPYATITTALRNASDGDTVIVRPGTYQGRQRLDGQFDQGVTVRSETPYQARLRHNSGAAVTVFTGRGITLEGFDIAHSPDNQGGLVVQVQDLLGDIPGAGSSGDDDVVSRITFRNNIIHDSTDNDLLKINNGAQDVVVENNMFFNQAGSDEHMDVNSVRGVIIRGNVFFNTTPQAVTSSFIVIKDSNGSDDSVLGSSDITVVRNIFANWQGNTGQSFIRVGEDGTANFEADNVLIESNLLLGNSSTLMRSAMTVMGSTNVTIRNNTVSGDLPARSFAARLIASGSNQPNQNVAFYNNIWSDPTGTMGTEAFSGVDVFDAPPEQNGLLIVDTNLYFNGGGAIPADTTQAIKVSDDSMATFGDPLLPDPAGVVLPVWDGATFADGSSTVREAFLNLAASGQLGTASAAIDAADPTTAARLDLLGRLRQGAPDLGAVEDLADVVFGDGFEILNLF